MIVALVAAHYLRYPGRPLMAGETAVLVIDPSCWVAVFRTFDLYAPSTCRPPLLPAHRGRPPARRRLQGAGRDGWRPRTGFEELVGLMVDADIALLEDELAGRTVRIDRP